MIKAIIFDNFGVLVTSHWEEFWSSLPSREQQNKTRQLNRDFDGGRINKKTFLEAVHKTTGKTHQEISLALFGHNSTKNTQLLRYIKELKPKYKIGLLSNISSDWIRKELLTADEQKYFDDMLFSFEVGMTKPDPKIFTLACARLGVKPDEAILVDDIERYCTVAESLGMKAVCYTNYESMKRQLELLLADTDNQPSVSVA